MRALQLWLLKRKARKLYSLATDFHHLDCGRAIAEQLRPQIFLARRKFSAVWEQIRALDSNAPKDPFTGNTQEGI